MRRVSVVVTDPWSFVDQHGSRFIATVRDVDGDLVLLELADALYVASPRNGDGYSLTPTTAERCQEGAPWGSDKWRGQPTALLADIQGL